MNEAANVPEIAIEIKIQIPIYYIRPPILIIRIISIIRVSPKRSINVMSKRKNESISGLNSSLNMKDPSYVKLFASSSIWPFIFISLENY